MDYHSVSKIAETQEEVTENNALGWKTEVAFGIDPIASCWPVAGSDFVGFDLGQAEKMFRLLYNDYYGYSSSVFGGQSFRHVCFKDQRWTVNILV